jgi:hypothetical protein
MVLPHAGAKNFTHFGVVAACDDARVGRVVWSVREGRAGDFDAPELVDSFRSTNPVHEPKLGELLYLPDGSGPWRVVDWAVADRAEAPGNVLVVQAA